MIKNVSLLTNKIFFIIAINYYAIDAQMPKVNMLPNKDSKILKILMQF